MSRERGVLAALLAASLAPGCARPAGGAAATAGRRPNRVSVTLQQDLGFVSVSNACSRESQLAEGIACFRSNETQYHGTPLLDAGADHAGLTPATTRLLLGFDRVLFEHVTIGLRGGYVFSGGGPRPDGAAAHPFFPFHGEARLAYWLGASPGSASGARLGLFLGGGLAQVDTPWRVLVEEDTTVRPSAAQPTNPAFQTLTAYKKSGTSFVGGGATLACDVDAASSFFLGIKLMELFPSSGTVLAPEIGYEHGF